MIDVLLFRNDDSESENMKRDERIECFGRTLNDAFKQFQRLWVDYTESLKRCEEYKRSLEEVGQKAQNGDRNADLQRCTCRAADQKAITILETGTSTLPSNPKKSDCDSIDVTKNVNNEQSSEQLDDASFEIFSEDFCTQGLEESFVNQSKETLEKIENVAPDRPKSPIIGSKKERTRISSLANSPSSLSDKSVVIINDFDKEKNFNIENRSISNSSLQSNDVVSSTNALSSPIRLSLSVPEVCTTPHAPKNISKWEISTVHNVNTDIIVGKNKTLKQSKLVMVTEKVTDLSNCDDVFNRKLEDRGQAAINNVRSNATKDTNLTQPDCDYCVEEDSMIQGSPEHEKNLSKMPQRIAWENKKIQLSQQKLNIDRSVLGDRNNVGNRVNFIDTDSDMTVFDPKLYSTQYTNLPSTSSKIVRSKKSPAGRKPDSEEGMDVENEDDNDPNVIDETIFDENLIPSNSRSQKRSSSERAVKKKKLSLKKPFNVQKHPQGIQNDGGIFTFDKGIDSPVFVSSSEEIKEASPPSKKISLHNFNVLPRKKNSSPTYAYKGSPVRKKDERALLNGWSCMNCQKYYEAMGLTEEELQDRKNICSRHRSKFNEKPGTQEGYWNPDFSSSFHSTVWNDD